MDVGCRVGFVVIVTQQIPYIPTDLEHCKRYGNSDLNVIDIANSGRISTSTCPAGFHITG
jgi:hypothetical protein